MIRFIIKLPSLALVFNILGCGAAAPRSYLREAWNPANRPEIISGPQIVTQFEKLALRGQVEAKGWSDTYWPTYMGGISYRWLTGEKNYPSLSEDATGMTFKDQSPAEKYDILLGRFDFPTVSDERRRTGILKTLEGTEEFDPGHEIPSWEGLCHGWAPAAHNFMEPKQTVSMEVAGDNAVVFYPSDIKALLIYYQQYSGNRSTRTVFAGERCNQNFTKLQEQFERGEITQEQRDAVRESSACRDVNAGTLHLVLANELGIAKRGFVVDVTRDAEVWNQPVNSYESQVIEDKSDASPGAAPGTVREVRIATKMTYTVETGASRTASGSSEQAVRYEYVLELDSTGTIIGGRWLSDDRPDFLWRESAPIFQGYFKRLEQLYKKSIAES